MSKQDKVYPRTAAQLERQYNFGKAFNEVLGIADDARRIAEEAKAVSAEIAETNNGIALRVENLEQGLSAQFQVTIEEAEDGETGETKVFSLIDGEATEIHFKSNSLIVESDYFTLDREGKIFATGGRIGNCSFDENGDLVIPTSCFAEKITADKINANGIVATGVDITGRITATEGWIGDCELVNGQLVVKRLSTFDEGTKYTVLINKEGIGMTSGDGNTYIVPKIMRVLDTGKKVQTDIKPGQITFSNTDTEAYAMMQFETDGMSIYGLWDFSDTVRVNSFYVGETRLSEDKLKSLLALLN